MVVNLVEVTSVEQLVEKVQKGKFKNGDEIMAKSRTSLQAFNMIELTGFTVKAAISEDDDIVAGPQKMSLKCPVSSSTLTLRVRLTQRFSS